jgi:hypothetical protein
MSRYRGRSIDTCIGEDWNVAKFVLKFIEENYKRKLAHANYFIKEFRNSKFLMHQPDDGTCLVAAMIKGNGEKLILLDSYSPISHGEIRSIMRYTEYRPYMERFSYSVWEDKHLDITEARIIDVVKFKEISLFLLDVDNRSILIDINPHLVSNQISHDNYLDFQDIEDVPEGIRDGWPTYKSVATLIPGKVNTVKEARQFLAPTVKDPDKLIRIRGRWFERDQIIEVPEVSEEERETAKWMPVPRYYGIPSDVCEKLKGRDKSELNIPFNQLATKYSLNVAQIMMKYKEDWEKWRKATKKVAGNFGIQLKDKLDFVGEYYGGKYVGLEPIDKAAEYIFESESGDMYVKGTMTHGLNIIISFNSWTRCFKDIGVKLQ